MLAWILRGNGEADMYHAAVHCLRRNASASAACPLRGLHQPDDVSFSSCVRSERSEFEPVDNTWWNPSSSVASNPSFGEEGPQLSGTFVKHNSEFLSFSRTM